MSGRPIISYDDITLPYDSQPSEAAPPPAKKAKTNNHQHQNYHNGNGNASGSGSGRQYQHQHAHWDDPSASSTSVKGHGGGAGAPSGSGGGKKANNKKAGSNGNAYGKGNAGGSGSGKQKQKAKASFSVNMSRELTHDEIWDDSALVEAWDAAMEEYQAFNGPGKGWKEEPLVKSALWYNTPPKKDSSTNEDEGEHDVDEAYLEGDYEDYAAEDLLAEGELDNSEAAQVPGPVAHAQPALPGPAAAPAPAYDISGAGPGASLSTVSQDEAFSRALNAMYWGGYWTAVYHCHRGKENPAPAATATAEDEKVGVSTVDGVEDEGEPERDEDASSDNMNTV